MHEHAYSTQKKYIKAFKRFQWCRAMGVSYLPAAPEHVALYLVDIGLQAATAATSEAASCAIQWAHHKACLAIPTEHALVSQTVKASQHLLARPAAKKKVLTLVVFGATV